MDINNERSKQIKQYDKIFKENLEAALPGIMQYVLGIELLEMEDLTESIQHTKERTPDVLKKVKDKQGNIFILHLEFQLSNEPEMAYRMAEYYIMLARKFKMPIKPHVIYIGNGKPTMPSEVKLEHLTFHYPLLVLSSVDYQLFLQSTKPEEIILALLADYGNEEPKVVMELIVNRVINYAQGELSVKKYMQQLRVLAGLRNLVAVNNEIMESLAKYLKEENDILFIRGEQKGEQIGLQKGELKAKTAWITHLLLNSNFTVSEIAKLVDISEELVIAVQKSLN